MGHGITQDCNVVPIWKRPRYTLRTIRKLGSVKAIPLNQEWRAERYRQCSWQSARSGNNP